MRYLIDYEKLIEPESGMTETEFDDWKKDCIAENNGHILNIDKMIDAGEEMVDALVKGRSAMDAVEQKAKEVSNKLIRAGDVGFFETGDDQIVTAVEGVIGRFDNEIRDFNRRVEEYYQRIDGLKKLNATYSKFLYDAYAEGATLRDFL